MEKYCANKKSNWWSEESKPLSYTSCSDGIKIHKGSLFNSGFACEYLDGITLPEEIDGIPVVELNGEYYEDEIGYIEATHLKRIFLCIKKNESVWSRDSHVGEMSCKFPGVCGGAQETLETVELTFISEKMHISGFCDLPYLKKVNFVGEVVDNPDWEYGHFESELFRGCSGLVSINGCFKGYRLSGSTFHNCISLIQPPDIRVKYFGDHEFENCRNLQKIHLHNGLIELGCSTFKNCISLKDIYIPDTVRYIGNYSFENCTRLQTIHLPDIITEIKEGLFRGCSRLKKVYLADSIKKIESEAFYGCKMLTSPWIPKNIESIGERAFYGCRNIGSIFLPETLKSIGKDAFSNCSDLVIKGKANTLAEEFALKNKIRFIIQ